MNKIVNLTETNYTLLNNKNNLYIVLHYVGQKSTAQNNGNYFKTLYRGASANYFVDENDCVQVVDDKNSSWHCGTYGTYKHPTCRNSNSIGIEMCCNRDANGKLFIEQATVDNTIELVKELMTKYNIPVENVIRHYDVTGKLCPAPYVDENKWTEFKSKLGQIVPVQPTFQSYQVQVTATPNLRKRAEPNTNSNILGVYETNTIVTIVDRSNNWGKDNSGTWICLDYTKPYTPIVAPQKKWYARYRTNATINVHSTPSLGNVIRTYKQGQVFDIYEEKAGFGHSPSGWIKLSFCTKIW